MTRALIVDDDQSIWNVIESHLHGINDVLIVGKCATIAEAEHLINSIHPDLLFLDIELRDGSGFEVLQKTNPSTYSTIFITAYDKFAIKAFRYGALDYLLKPIIKSQFLEALHRHKQPPLPEDQVRSILEVAKQHLKETTSRTARIVLRHLDAIQVVRLADIIYCEGKGSYTSFHLKDGAHALSSKPLIEYEKLLPKEQFLRPHL